MYGRFWMPDTKRQWQIAGRLRLYHRRGDPPDCDFAVKNIVDAHVHRVLVVDNDGKLQGMISTIDVLAALQRANN